MQRKLEATNKIRATKKFNEKKLNLIDYDR